MASKLMKYEYRRKVIHFFLGLSLVLIYNFFLDKFTMQLFVLICLSISLFVSMYTKYTRPVYVLRILKLFDKPKDIKTFPGRGVIYYLFGVLLALIFFNEQVASASIMILAVGDPMAHIIAKYYGETKLAVNKKKLLEGTLAGTFFGTIAASFFVPIPIAFFGAAYGMIAEAIELKFFDIDDNFYIPFVSGLIMAWIMSYL